MASTSTAAAYSDEWEVVVDDGFVYKRKKRRPYPTSLARPPDPAPDPVSVERERRSRKRKALIELKEKYEREISHWEHLSNTLKEIEEKTARSRRDQRDYDEVIGREDADNNEGSRSVGSTKKRSKSWVDGLILQVEEQEQFLHTFSHLCDVAETLCNVQDEKTKRAYLDLDVWTCCSPRKLVASLTDDD